MNSDEIIITSLVRYGEADCIARVFTREEGRMSVFCRNAFKPSKKRGSVLQAPARGRMTFKAKSSGMATMSELDLGAYTHALASNLRGFALAAYATELIEIFVPEHDSVPQLFDLLDNFLKQAATAELSTGDIRAFEFKLLELSGLLSEQEASVNDLREMATVFVRHLKQHKQTPLKSLAFFKQVIS
ncbi:MAG: DNA repair protein RecO [Myxococcaceae bacterium]